MNPRPYWTIFLTLVFFLTIGLRYRSNSEPSVTLTPQEENWVRILTRQTARWALAAQQDASAVIALLHANYAAGYLWALKDLVSNETIARVANIDVDKLTSEVVKIQDWATKRVLNQCKVETGNPYLAKVAGDA